MITAVNINATKKYASKHDPSPENPTIFHIGLLDHNLNHYIDDQVTNFEIKSKNSAEIAKASYNLSRRNYLAVKFGLKEVENMTDPETNKPIKFDTVSVPVGSKNYMAATDRQMSMFSKALVDELAEVILNENRLTEDETKN
ncbi:MAG: hypothetical protein WDL87_01985 [Candidatus Omnitrophota bacterium]|jgi:hypothetical protein